MDITISETGWERQLRDHLLSLDANSRRRRFLGPIGDDQIREFCERSRASAVLFARDGEEVVGVAELHIRGGEAELGISVRPDRQGMGYGGQLFTEALEQAQLRGATEMTVLFSSGNVAVARLCARYGATLEHHGGDVEAHIPLSDLSNVPVASM